MRAKSKESRFYYLKGIKGVYIIVCPITHKVVYVGQCQDAQLRILVHICSTTKSKTPVSYWIKDIIKQGLFPLFCMIETFSDYDADMKVAERKWINYYLKRYPDLLNRINTPNNPLLKANKMLRSIQSQLSD